MVQESVSLAGRVRERLQRYYIASKRDAGNDQALASGVARTVLIAYLLTLRYRGKVVISYLQKPPRGYMISTQRDIQQHLPHDLTSSINDGNLIHPIQVVSSK